MSGEAPAHGAASDRAGGGHEAGVGGGGTSRSRTLPDRLLGVVGGAMVAAAVLLLLFGGPADVAPVGGLAPPRLALVEPSDGDVVAPPLRIVFVSEEPLRWREDGWGVDSLHVHAEIDGQEVMPGPSDIRSRGATNYEWVVPGITGREVAVGLSWSDTRHRPVAGGESAVVRVRVE